MKKLCWDILEQAQEVTKKHIPLLLRFRDMADTGGTGHILLNELARIMHEA
jgi:hypothetical protein